MMLLLALGILANSCHLAVMSRIPVTQADPMPDPDGNLNIYALPTGQGDTNMIQCPDGTISIIDMGTSSDTTDGYWTSVQISEFLRGKESNIRNVLITHNHYDHYSLLLDTFRPGSLASVQNIYVSCTFDDMPSSVQSWVEGINGRDKIRLFNGGSGCGANGQDCGQVLDICPGNSQIKATPFGVNLGGNCGGGNKNIDSIVFQLTYNSFKMLFTGDFEDETSDWEADEQQRMMVNYWGAQMESTVYKIAHHGASFLANKPVFRDAIKPKAIIANNDPDFSYRHPRCVVVHGFRDYVRSLCKPGITNPSDPEYCSDSITGSDPASRVQTRYMCGISSSEPPELHTGNEYAIYTTGPDSQTINLITVKTDGVKWEINPQISNKL